MAERMTIHRGLAELKTLDSRINNAIREGIYCQANKRSNEKINGLSIEDFKEQVIKASYDRVQSLIARRKAIKTAIVASNAVTKVKINDVEMTVADAIERKASISYEKTLLNTMRNFFTSHAGRVNTENEALPKKLEAYLQAIGLGSKEKAKTEDVKAHTELFMNQNTYEFIDPLNLEKIIKEKDAEITGFLIEVDACLSESNAVTFIEV